MNKFSIILPVHNGGWHMKECIYSILNQSFQDFNLIVLDNCSTDGSLEWVKALNNENIIIYPLDKLLSIENNWKRIVAIEKNEFITMIGHDDILHQHYLAEMNALIQEHPAASLYQSHFNYVDKYGRIISPCKPMDVKQFGHEFLAAQMNQTIDSMGTGYMMRSVDYDRVGGIPPEYPNLIFADYQLWVMLSMISYKATSPKICFDYRIHNNVSKITNGDDYQKAFEKYIYFISDLAKKSNAVKEVVERYAYTFLMYFTESLSHRILKTPRKKRDITVAAYIDKCRDFAELLIPGQKFEPMIIWRIRIARQLDSNAISREAFHLIKKMTVLFSK